MTEQENENMVKYYTRSQVEAQGVPRVSVDRWSKMYRGTAFVWKKKGQRYRYSEDFVRFCLSRRGQTGPASLPDVQRTVLLFVATRHGKTVNEIAEVAQDDPQVIVAQLELFGLEVRK